jgi:hypothetical protein
MTEKQWLGAGEVGLMLAHLYRNAIVSDRKLRLFYCACCRRLRPLLDERARRVVEGAECYADGLLSERDLAVLWVAAEIEEGPWPDPRAAAFAAAAAVLLTARAAAERPPQSAALLPPAAAARVGRGEKKAQRQLLRDLVGNPFRPTQVQPAWRAWNGGTLVRMARVVYDECRFSDLPILADALEEAGCADNAILAHCRCGGEHARGCWVIDQLLGKE